MHKEVFYGLLLIGGSAFASTATDQQNWELRADYEQRMTPRLHAWDDYLGALHDDHPHATAREPWHGVYPRWRAMLVSADADWPAARQRFEQALRRFSHEWAAREHAGEALP